MQLAAIVLERLDYGAYDVWELVGFPTLCGTATKRGKLLDQSRLHVGALHIIGKTKREDVKVSLLIVRDRRPHSSVIRVVAHQV